VNNYNGLEASVELVLSVSQTEVLPLN